MVVLFDSHAHLTDDQVFPDIPSILAKAKDAGVERIVNICTNVASLKRGIALAKEHGGMVSNAGATPPHYVKEEGGLSFPLFEQAARNGDLVAIGETGLDYHYLHSPRDVQQTFLRRYFTLALELQLPVIFHCRKAFADLFSIADTDYKLNGKQHGRAVVHCFTGTMKEAEKALQRGWLLSLSGIVTFKRSEELREIVKEVPIDHLLLETDAPYLAPQSRRGEKNEPSFLGETARVVADVKEMSFEEVARITRENAMQFFSL